MLGSKRGRAQPDDVSQSVGIKGRTVGIAFDDVERRSRLASQIEVTQRKFFGNAEKLLDSRTLGCPRSAAMSGIALNKSR